MKKTQKKIFRLLDFRWLLLINTIVVIAAVSSFGLIGLFGLQMDESNAIFMLGMIPLMALTEGLTTWIVMRAMRRRMGDLLTGIQAVADGDLDVQLELKGSNEYKVIYNNFNQMTRELRNTKEQMQNFINEFSHEFKTPITSINGFAGYLLETGEEIETPERMRYLRIIADESLRLSELSQKTLLLSKVEACEIIVDKESFDLSEQIKRCVILLLRQFEKKKIEVNLDMPDIRYHGNAELMEQVWLNLLNNAVKFTPPNGEICVIGRQTDELIEIEISDTGIGMNEETTDRVFEKYYQGASGRSKGGNGIGLSIVKRIVTICDGEIAVRSAAGEGSTFTVTLKK